MNNDDLLQQAKQFAQEVDYISVSALQRKLLVGYTQAKQILEMLIKDGICEAEFTVGQGYLILKK